MIKSYTSIFGRSPCASLNRRPSPQPQTITLPLKMAQMANDKVASGQYATESEVIRDGLRSLAARDAAIEKWLVEEVVPTLDALDADPLRAIPADEAWRRIQAHMDAVTAAKR